MVSERDRASVNFVYKNVSRQKNLTQKYDIKSACVRTKFYHKDVNSILLLKSIKYMLVNGG